MKIPLQPRHSEYGCFSDPQRDPSGDPTRRSRRVRWQIPHLILEKLFHAFGFAILLNFGLGIDGIFSIVRPESHRTTKNWRCMSISIKNRDQAISIASIANQHTKQIALSRPRPRPPQHSTAVYFVSRAPMASDFLDELNNIHPIRW